jgi:transposase
MSLGEFTAAVRRQLPAAGGKRISQRIATAIHAAAAAPGGVEAGQDALAERAGFACADWLAALAELRRVEACMVQILDELHLTHLVLTIPGISAVGAAAILAETGDPARYDDPRAWVKHAGLAPRANESGTFRGATRTTGWGRPRLRTAAWRAIWGALPHNPVYTSRHAHLTGRGHNKLNDGKARSALAAALLRQLFVVITQRVPWDPNYRSTIYQDRHGRWVGRITMGVRDNGRADRRHVRGADRITLSNEGRSEERAPSRRSVLQRR